LQIEELVFFEAMNALHIELLAKGEIFKKESLANPEEA
jgi:hypothetical protein